MDSYWDDALIAHILEVKYFNSCKVLNIPCVPVKPFRPYIRVYTDWRPEPRNKELRRKLSVWWDYCRVKRSFE